jgi:hypothetical protein
MSIVVIDAKQRRNDEGAQHSVPRAKHLSVARTTCRAIAPAHGSRVATDLRPSRLLVPAIFFLLHACGGGSGSATSGATQLSPASVAFADTSVGLQSPAQRVTVTNPTTAELPIDAVTVSGAAAASFKMTNGCAASLAAAASCTILISFAPSSTGSLAASVAVRSGSFTSNATALAGTGVAPTVKLTATNVSFPATAVGATSASQTVSVSNTGSAPLTISAITLAGNGASAFTEANTCTTVVAPAADCIVTLAFAPTVPGTVVASLVLKSNAAGTPPVLLSGLAVQAQSPTQVLKALLASPPMLIPYQAVTTQLASDLSADATGIAVISSAGFPSAGNFIALLSENTQSEYVLVTGGAGTNSWNVIRAYNGSAAASFPAAGTTVTYMRLATQRAASINGVPITQVASTFTTSVGAR